MNTATDPIWWGPLETRGSVLRLSHHRCPHAVVVSLAIREQLDPMALGTCRFCGERLPLSSHLEKAT